MKNLKFFDKIIWILNIVVAVMLLLSYLLPYVEPKRFVFVSILSLGVPFLILTNLIFLIYWTLRLKAQLILSLLVLGIGYNYVLSLYKFADSDSENTSLRNLSVMNYNVRLFNVFNWIENDHLKENIRDLIKDEKPDVICLQEYRPDKIVALRDYYKYEDLTGQKVKSGQAIFSKFPIINSGSIEFPNSNNNAIFADIVVHHDTIRIYNVHLQSMKIDANTEITNANSRGLLKRLTNAFGTQQLQAELFIDHRESSPHEIIICGDFNNTAYSYVYKQIKGGLADAFVNAGSGFGRTLDFKIFPMRIDFILYDRSFEINSFKTYTERFSDHFPIMANFSLD